MYLVHDKFMDVFFEVIKTTYRGPKYKKIKGRWWNLGFVGQPFPLGLGNQTITITHKDSQYWKFFDPNTDTHPGRQNV
jgi:hypothetical protein